MEIKEIKKTFYSYRNGIISDLYRKNGDSHRMIFGLNLPQIAEIAKTIGEDKELASTLWKEFHVRESQMLAIYLFPRVEFDKDTALEWIKGIADEEIADILCFKMLKYQDYSEQLCFDLINETDALHKYIGFRLALNLLMAKKLNNKDLLSSLLPQDTSSLSRGFNILLQNIKEKLEF